MLGITHRLSPLTLMASGPITFKPNPEKQAKAKTARKRSRWGKVAEGREAFKANAKAYVQMHKKGVRQALANGKEETAIKGAEWALSHLQDVDSEGKEVRPIGESIDAAKQVQVGNGGVTVQIVGFTTLPQAPSTQAKLPSATVPEGNAVVEGETLSDASTPTTNDTNSSD